MSVGAGDTLGRFTLERMVEERSPLVTWLATDADGRAWLVTTWSVYGRRVDGGALEDAVAPLRRLTALTPDAEIDVLVGDHGDAVALARPRSAGTSVAAWVAQDGTRPPAEVTWLGLRLLDRLGEVRGALPGVLHGGITPATTYVTDAPRTAVLTGFAGPTRAVSLALGDPLEGPPPWTAVVDPAYAPPELRIGDHTSPATDLYGIAGTMLFALTGRTPRDYGGRISELEDLLVEERSTPRVLARFLGRALSPTLEARFANVEEATDALTGRAAERLREQARSAPRSSAVGSVFAPVDDKARKAGQRGAGLGLACSVPNLLIALTALAGLPPFPSDVPLAVGGLVAFVLLAASAGFVFLATGPARKRARRRVVFEEFVLRVEGPGVRGECRWTSLRRVELTGGGLELTGVWSNGSGGWLDTDTLRLEDVYDRPLVEVRDAILAEHAVRAPAGFVDTEKPAKKEPEARWLLAPAAVLLVGWGGGVAARLALGDDAAVGGAVAAHVIELEALHADPSQAFAAGRPDPGKAAEARAELGRTVSALAAREAVAAEEGEGTVEDAGAPPCPAGMERFALVEGAAIPPACVDGGGIMVRVARPTATGPAWSLVDWTEVPVRAYGACAAVGNCPPVESGEGCRQGVEKFSDYPANCVTKAGAEAYCRRVGRRLCATDEWYAAAGAPSAVEREGWPSGEPSCATAVIRDPRGPGCGLKDAWPIGARVKGASRFGAVDLVGNVAEWVADAPPGVTVGGSYLSASGTQGGIASMEFDAGGPAPDVGFRCCRDLAAPGGR